MLQIHNVDISMLIVSKPNIYINLQLYVSAIFMHIYVLNNIALLNQLLWGDIKYRVGNDTMRFRMVVL